MSSQFHHLWRVYQGKTLYVRIGAEKFRGVLIGLQPAAPATFPVREDAQPWAIETANGILMVDPDNPAVSIFDESGLITCHRQQSGLWGSRQDPSELGDLYKKSIAAAAKAETWQSQHPLHGSGAIKE
jgi:hypothetical protein